MLMWYLLHRPTLIPRVLWMVWQAKSTLMPFLSTHYSIIPSRLGTKQAVRYSLQPCTNEDQPKEPMDREEFVGDKIQEYLNDHTGCMKWMIQKQQDPCSERVDDVLTEWTTPWEEVGILRIPEGSKLFNTFENCEDLSYNPMHALDENRPLGWMAKIRAKSYAKMAALRLSKNHPELK